MPYCYQCGVELNPKASLCPLCQTPVPFLDKQSEPEVVLNTDPSRIFLTKNQKRLRFFSVLVAFVGLPLVILIAIDFWLSGTLTWSQKTTSIFAAILTFLGICFFNRHHLLVTIIGFFLSALLLLFLLDFCEQKTVSWSYDFGLPLITLTTLLVILTIWYCRKTSSLGYNLFGWLLCSCAIFCLGLELLITLTFFHRTSFSWSLITSFTLALLGLFFFFLHYILKLPFNFQQTFHF